MVRVITEGERVMLQRLRDIVCSRIPISPSVALAIAAEVLPRYLKDMPQMQVSLFLLFRSAGLSLGRFRKWARTRGISLQKSHGTASPRRSFPASRISKKQGRIALRKSLRASNMTQQNIKQMVKKSEPLSPRGKIGSHRDTASLLKSISLAGTSAKDTSDH